MNEERDMLVILCYIRSGVRWIMRQSKILLIIFSTILLLSACNTKIQPQTTMNVQQIISKTTSAFGTINEYKMDSEVNMKYEIAGGQNPSTHSMAWHGHKYVNMAKREMKKAVDIDADITGIFQRHYSTIEKYSIGGYLYSKIISSGLTQPNPWSKTKLTDEVWISTEAQHFSNQEELLETAVSFSYAGEEKVNNIECFVLRLIPSTSAIVEWTLLQNEQGNQEEKAFGGPAPGLFGEYILNRVRHDSLITIWIAKDSLLPVKEDIQVSFSATPGDFPDSAIGLFDKITRTMQGTLDFHDYNKISLIELPNDAINAQEFAPAK